MTVTVPYQSTWPDGDPGKVLLNCIINTSVDQAFEELFGSYSQTQAKLHKQRNDTNCAESPWVSQRSQLPSQQFIWPAPPAGADPGSPAPGCCRKVRFDAAPSIASKAFSSEEVQRVLLYAPGSHYQLETEVSTTAMYGDQFTVISRYTLAAGGPNKSHLYVLYAVAFKPSLSRLMKPMVAKGVDGGIRGSFTVLKKLLQEQYGLSDLPDTAPQPTIPGAPAVVAAAAAAEAPAAELPPAAAQVPAAPALSAPALLSLADYVVYQELVASIVQVSEPQLVAKALAMCLTMVLIHTIIILLRPISQACAAASASAAAGGGAGGLLSWLCWPLSLGLDIPDSLGEVLGALLLVAVANKLLLLGVEVVAAVLKGSPSAPSAMASRAPSVLGAALSAVAAAATSSLPSAAAAAAAATANGIMQGDSGAPAATAAAAAAVSDSSQAQKRGKNKQRSQAQAQKSSPVAIPGKTVGDAAAAAAGGGGNGGGGSGGGVEAALSNFGNVMTGWGRNLLGSNVVDSLSSNEGFKALMTGSWTKPTPDSAKDDAGQGPGTGPANKGAAAGTALAVSLNSSGSGPARTISHRHTTSFTAVMDPSGLNIIEDYALQSQHSMAQQAAQQHLPQLVEEQGTAASSPAASEAAGPFAAAAVATAAELKANGTASAKAAAAAGAGAGGSPSRSPARNQSPAGRGATGPSSSSVKPLRRAGSSKTALSEASDAEARQPLLAASGSADGGAADTGSQAGSSSTAQQQGPGQGAAAGSSSRPSTPVPGDDTSVPPLLASSSPVVTQGGKHHHHHQQQQGDIRSSSKSVTFSGSPHSLDSSTAGLLASSHSASALLGAAGAVGGAKGAGSAGGLLPSAAAGTRSSPLARRSASPMLYGASHSAESALPGVAAAASSPAMRRLGMSAAMSASYEALSASSASSSGSGGGGGGSVAVEPGEEDADEVLVEVFEHERVQPFRGWGHSWPGHFLPSDKVGHWGDRSGAPGGVVSMLFDRVAPKLPAGWAWQDAEWVVDMTGAEAEGCDAEGWAYGMDFSWLTWPPAPQMGRPGLKSFVRRRRWVRARTRLPPGGTSPPEASLPESEPVLRRPAPQLQPGSAPTSARGSEVSGDGGFMAGLSSGLGLVGNDSAAAAAAAANAMVTRFMKAVSDLPLTQRASFTGSEPPGGLSTSPAGSGAGGGPAAAAGAVADSGTAPAATDAAGLGAASSTPNKQAAGVSGAGGVAAAAAGGAQQQQQQQGVGVGVSSRSSNAGSSQQGGESGNVSDSDSSSVDSNAPPPRPRLSEALADLQQEPAAGGPSGHTAAAAGSAALEVGPTAAAAAAVVSACPANTAEAVVTSAEGGTQHSAVSAVHATSPPVGKAAVAAAGVTASPDATDTAAAAASKPRDAVSGAVAAAHGVGSSSTAMLPAGGDDQPQEGLPAHAPHTPEVPPTTGPQSPAAGPESAAGRGSAAAAAHLPEAGGGAATSSESGTASPAVQQQQQSAHKEPTEQPAPEMSPEAGNAADTSAVPASTSCKAEPPPPPADNTTAAGAADNAAGAAALGPTCTTGDAATHGSSDGVCPTTEAQGKIAPAAAAAVAAAAGPGPALQSGADVGAAVDEMPTSPSAVDTSLQHRPSRTSSGGTIARTGSGARGSRGKKLGAIPLRRSAQGAGTPQGAAGSSSGGGAAQGVTGSASTTAGGPTPTHTTASVSGDGAADVTAALSAAHAVSGPSGVSAAGVAAQEVSGDDDMGSGLGWASSPERQQTGAVGSRSQQQQVKQ